MVDRSLQYLYNTDRLPQLGSCWGKMFYPQLPRSRAKNRVASGEVKIGEM